MNKLKLLTFYYLFCLSAEGQGRAETPYNYFIPEVKIPDSDSRIEITKKGDTVLVSRFQIQNNTTNTNQILTKTYKNTPFFQNRWQNGEVWVDKDQALSFVMAYNIQKGVVYLVYNPEEVATVMKPMQFTVGGHSFKQFKKRYYETIHSGKYEVLKEYQCLLQLNKTTQNTGYESETREGEFEGEFVKSVKYYLKKENGIRSIPAGKRFYRLFGGQGESIKNYVKKQQLDSNKEKDLVAIFKYFESL